jgi:hypothetical protein
LRRFSSAKKLSILTVLALFPARLVRFPADETGITGGDLFFFGNRLSIQPS